MSAFDPLRTLALFGSSPTEQNQRQAQRDARYCKSEPMFVKSADAVQAKQLPSRQADDPVQKKPNPVARRLDAQSRAPLCLHGRISVWVRVT